MKNTSANRLLIISLSFIATLVLTGCPSSREGSGTGAGHKPSNVSTDTSSTDGSRTGTGHAPSVRMVDTTKRGTSTPTLTSTDSSRPGTGHPPAGIKRDTTRKTNNIRPVIKS